MILKPFSAILSDALLPEDKYIPLTQPDMARLLVHIPEGEESFLTLRDNLNVEWVRAYNECGTILLERGVQSEAKKFPRGACLVFDTSVPVMEWLVCNHNCCEPDCKIEPVKLTPYVFNPAIVGHAWTSTVSYAGTMPITFDVLAPDWMKVVQMGNHLTFSGTPDAAGKFTVTVAAVNGQGQYVAHDTLPLTVVEVVSTATEAQTASASSTAQPDAFQPKKTKAATRTAK